MTDQPTNQPTDGHEGSFHREVTLPKITDQVSALRQKPMNRSFVDIRRPALQANYLNV